MRVWIGEEVVLNDPNDIDGLIQAMRFKARNIKAKADPEIFETAADYLIRYKKMVRGDKGACGDWIEEADNGVNWITCPFCDQHVRAIWEIPRNYCGNCGKKLKPYTPMV